MPDKAKRRAKQRKRATDTFGKPIGKTHTTTSVLGGR